MSELFIPPPSWAQDAPAALAGLRQAGHAELTPMAVGQLAGCALPVLSQLSAHWDDLPADAHLKDGGRYRRRRHGSYVQDLAAGTLHAVPHRPHWQPTTYNALHGGMLRWFEPLAHDMATSVALLGLIAGLGRLFAQAARPLSGEPAFDGHWFVEAHPFRIDTTGGVGRPTPEGAHRDGVNFVAVLLVDRAGVSGGETRVFDAHGPHGVRFTLHQPWSALLLDDARVVHESTPIQPAAEAGHRDTLVLTYRGSGFQKPAGARMSAAYTPRRNAVSLQLPVRGLSYRVWRWGEPSLATPTRPAVFLLHGWMDVGASFQFMVDALAGERCLYAPDWRGFGQTRGPATDAYWFPDYLGDLDALLDSLSTDRPVDLVAHSMGANVAMAYAGIRPARVRRLVNLEGFGLPETPVSRTPQHHARWLDELKTPQAFKTYADLDEVAERLRRNNPRLTPERAVWLAPHWAALNPADGRYHVQGDPAHKRLNAVRYRADEALACWAAITAPLLWVEGRQTDVPTRWRVPDARAVIDARIARLATVERAWLDDCGHMLQHDQPAALAALVERFLDRP